MNKIRTLVVDDEPAARKGVVRLLQQDPEIEVVGEASDGQSAVEAIRTLQPDLLFLDVQMPELDGFQVLETVGPGAVKTVVFVTAYDQFAVRAFEVQALDYLLKPFEDERFELVLARAKGHVRAANAPIEDRIQALLASYAQRGATADYLTRIAIKEGGTVSFVAVDTVDWIEAADYYARLHAGSTSQLIRYTLNDLERQLDPRQFQRVHRSAIVNLKRVKEIRLDYQNRHVIVLTNGTRIPLSRSKKDAIEEAISRGA